MELESSHGISTQGPSTEGPESFELVYEGPEVDDGSMDARQLSEVLSGMTRAFSTVAYELELGDRYELRVVDVEKNSFHIVLSAIEYAKSNPAAASAIAAGSAVALSVLTNSVSGAYRVITDIAKYIDAKKRLRGAKVATLSAQFQDHEVRLLVGDDLIVMTKEQYELLLSQRIDRPVSQIVSPLAPNKINTFQIRSKKAELATIDAKQREYFDVVETTEERVQDGTELVGMFNSLSKNNLRGTFYTSEGVHVPYKYVGGDVAMLLRGFTAREQVRVHGRVKYASDGIPSYLEVQDIQIVQRGFFPQ